MKEVLVWRKGGAVLYTDDICMYNACIRFRGINIMYFCVLAILTKIHEICTMNLPNDGGPLDRLFTMANVYISHRRKHNNSSFHTS